MVVDRTKDFTLFISIYCIFLHYIFQMLQFMRQYCVPSMFYFIKCLFWDCLAIHFCTWHIRRKIHVTQNSIHFAIESKIILFMRFIMENREINSMNKEWIHVETFPVYYIIWETEGFSQSFVIHPWCIFTFCVCKYLMISIQIYLNNLIWLIVSTWTYLLCSIPWIFFSFSTDRRSIRLLFIKKNKNYHWILLCIKMAKAQLTFSW